MALRFSVMIFRCSVSSCCSWVVRSCVFCLAVVICSSVCSLNRLTFSRASSICLTSYSLNCVSAVEMKSLCCWISVWIWVLLVYLSSSSAFLVWSPARSCSAWLSEGVCNACSCFSLSVISSWSLPSGSLIFLRVSISVRSFCDLSSVCWSLGCRATFPLKASGALYLCSTSIPACFWGGKTVVVAAWA